MQEGPAESWKWLPGDERSRRRWAAGFLRSAVASLCAHFDKKYMEWKLWESVAFFQLPALCGRGARGGMKHRCVLASRQVSFGICPAVYV